MSSRDEAIHRCMGTTRGSRKRARAATVESSTPSCLTRLLLELWAWGVLSSPLVQTISDAAVKEIIAAGGHPSQSLLQMQAIGTAGANPNLCRRDLVRKFAMAKSYLSSLVVRVPCVPVKKIGEWLVHLTDVPVVMPNEMFEHLWENFPIRFQELLGGGLRAFWSKVRDIARHGSDAFTRREDELDLSGGLPLCMQSFRIMLLAMSTQVRNDDPRMMHHPMRNVPGWMDRAVPITVHGDGVRFSMAGNVLLTYQWAITTAISWGWDSIFYIASFAKVCRSYASIHGEGTDTWAVLWDYIRLGFDALYNGVHPSVDPYGMPWPVGSRQAAIAGKRICNGHYFGVIWVIANDKEHACNELGQTHFNGNKCCSLCGADRSEHNVRDVRSDARWRGTLAMPRPLDGPEFNHPLWKVVGVNRFMDVGDWQHSVDSGALLQLHGGCIRDLTAPDGPFAGGNVAWRFARLWEALQSKYIVGEGCKLQTLTETMIGKPSEFPALTCKSAQSRHLVKPMLALLRDIGATNEKAGHRIQAYELMCEMITIVWGQGIYLTEASALRLRDACDEYLLHYNALVVLSRENNGYNFTTKIHFMWHRRMGQCHVRG
jgi:hypothetical protein